MLGHTTIMTLCGFAYGMKGFFIGLAGSVLGAAIAFVVLRFLFSERLRKWSATNDKWTALETVVVSEAPMCVSRCFTSATLCFRNRRAFHWSF